MDQNIALLLILLGVAMMAGVLAILIQSTRIRRHGIIGALRRKFSGGAHRSDYSD